MDSQRLQFIHKLRKERGLHEVLVSKKEYVKLGSNVKIKEFTSIGTDGFGYERNQLGRLEKFPHYGKVIIGNDVGIGSFTTIDRGNMTDTVIGDGTKIDNLVHIGHNAKIGKNCLIVAGCVIGGSCIIGDYTNLAMGVLVRPHVKIGKNCIIGMGSVVLNDIPDNCIAYGNPAKIIAYSTREQIWQKSFA